MLEWLGRALGAHAVIAIRSTSTAVHAAGASVVGRRDAWRHSSAPVPTIERSAFDLTDDATIVRLGRRALDIDVVARWEIGRCAMSDLVLGVANPGGEVTPADLAIFATGLTMILSRDMALVDARMNALLLERARIASDIHQGVCQEMATLRLQLQVLEQLIECDPPRASSLRAEIERSADLCSKNLRSAVMHLTPLTPDNTWLDGGLRAYVNDVALAWGVGIGFELRGQPRALDPEPLELVLAFVQEGLTNIEKHAGARSAAVRITFESDAVRVDVGSGDVDEARKGSHVTALPFGHGLSLMQGRARLLGGEMRFVRSTNNRTLLSLELPQ